MNFAPNVGSIDKIVRIVVGALLILLALSGTIVCSTNWKIWRRRSRN